MCHYKNSLYISCSLCWLYRACVGQEVFKIPQSDVSIHYTACTMVSVCLAARLIKYGTHIQYRNNPLKCLECMETCHPIADWNSSVYKSIWIFFYVPLFAFFLTCSVSLFPHIFLPFFFPRVPLSYSSVPQFFRALHLFMQYFPHHISILPQYEIFTDRIQEICQERSENSCYDRLGMCFDTKLDWKPLNLSLAAVEM